MPLYDASRRPLVAPEDAVVVVHDFLEKCRAWALEQEIPKRTAKVAEGNNPEEAAKLEAWHAYVRFTEHTLREIEEGTLDRWFPPGG